MQSRIFVPVLILCALIALAGCTGTPTPPSSVTSSGPVTQTTQAGAVSLVPGPTDAMLDNNVVIVDVSEKDYLGIITVTFQGGKGQMGTKKVDVKLTRVDGSVQSATIGTKKGDEVELQGTKGSGSERGQADRVEVWVTMNTGQTYKIVDVLREYRSRG